MMRARLPILLIQLGIAAALCLSSASCTADRTGSLRAFGSWIRDDGKALVRDIENAPAFFSDHFSREGRDFVNVTKFALERTSRDVHETQSNISGAPAYLARDARRSLNSLSLNAKAAALWTSDDATQSAHNITGAPVFLAREGRYEWRDFKVHFGMLSEQAESEWRDFPSAIGRTLAIMFLR